MPSHSETQLFPYSTQQLFELVADIGRYPEFLPWCKAARILERRDNELLAELVIRFGHMSESYTSRVLLTPPLEENGEGAIDVTMVRGPFAHLTNRWRFTPRENNTAQVDFFLDFAFRSRILEKMIGSLFTRATNAMVDAFKARANALYGKADA